jgi:hypothetical protein
MMWLPAWSIEEKRLDGFADVRAQFVPIVSLSKDILGETLGALTAVALLRHLKDDFIRRLHGVIVASYGIYI